MTSIAVLIPVLDRPHHVRPLVENILPTSTPEIQVLPFFIVSPNDDLERAAIREAMREHPLQVDALDVEWEPAGGDYAKKMNAAANVAASLGYEWVFLGGDDISFDPGWAHAALRAQQATRACVVGTNDLGNVRVTHGIASTHTLVSVEYLECGTVDEPDSRKLLHEGYDHCFVDDELVGTALMRQTYYKAHDVHVAHLHPHWGKAENDATYEKGQRRFGDDQALFAKRRVMWERPV